MNECELIDTLWNVNFLDDESSKYALIELIDTLWNVNKQTFPIASKQIRN